MALFSSGADSNDALRSRGATRGAGSSATLLPLSYTTSSSKDRSAFPTARRSPRHHHHHQYDDIPTPTCHNFLLGGNYFPGKDKRRKHIRKKKKNFWERLSPVKLGVITVVLLYVIRYLLFSSGARVQLQERRQPAGWWWTVPLTTTMQLKDRSQTHADAKRLQNKVNVLSENNKHLRHGIYEKLSPDWYHRDEPEKEGTPNDNPPEQVEETADKDQQQQKVKEDEINAKEEIRNSDIDKSKGGNAQAINQEADADNAKVAKDRAKRKEENPPTSSIHMESSEESGPISVRRTLQTMGSFSNRTSCPSDLSKEEIVTTLVVQSSLNRSWVLEETCKRWTDPIVAVITLTKVDSNLEISTFLQEWKVKCPDMYIVIHEMEAEQEDPAMYPVNHLRNLGLDHVKSSHLLMTDVDFVPSDGLAEEIRQAIKLREDIRAKDPGATDPQNREAIVVPAFERNLAQPCLTESECKGFLQQNSSFVPRDFDSLRDCVKNEWCTVFQSQDNWEGHHATRSEKWLAREWYEEDSTPKDLKRIPCFDSLRYEPYVVIRWCPAREKSPVVSAPFYDERFHGYGKNKIEYIQHLRFMGYRFAVLPRGFIVHNPHPPSKAKEVWNDMKKHSLHKDMDALYPTFLSELLEKFKDILDQAVGQCR